MDSFARFFARGRRRTPYARSLGVLGAGAALAISAGTASATWSIIIIDTRTGEIALGSATCLTNFDLQANTPVLIVGVGAATAQSSVDQDATNRTLIRDQLSLGTDPAQILALLAAKDASHQSRQYGIADTRGRTLTFSGTGASAWAGGLTGRIGDLVYAVQGNILVGPDVVGKAVEEILAPQGDVPDKLMRAMEKAAQFGGDGRCTVFGKSSHIAYMLVGRAGDRDASNGNYRLAQTQATIAVADLDGDSLPELLLGSVAGVSVLRNLTIPGRAPMFAPALVSATGGVSFRDLTTADLDNDAKADALGADFANDRIQILKGNGTLTLTPAVFSATGDGPAALTTADFNGDGFADIATANINAGTVSVLLNNGDGTFAPPVNYPAGTGTAGVRAGDVDGDGDADLAAISTSVRGLQVLRNNGLGVFTPEAGISFSTTPLGLALADLDHDGKAEIVLGINTETNVRVRRLNGADWVESLFPAGVGVGHVAVADVDADTIPDVVVRASSAQKIAVLRGLPGGGFAPPSTYPTGFNTSKFAVADLTNDGFPDAAVALATSPVAMAMFNNLGEFANVSGLAGGTYFLGLNVPNRLATDEDPVITLRTQFDAWRATLVGKVDAVQSQIEPALAHLPPVPGAPSSFTIRLRDYSGAPVTLPLQNVDVRRSGPGVTIPGSPILNTDGSITVFFTTGALCGADTYRVTVSDGPRPVVLMPDAVVIVSTAADVNLDGAVDDNDSTLFVSWFNPADPRADFNADGFVDGIDYDTFMNLFEQGC